MSVETEISALKFKVNKVLEEKKYVFYMNTASLSGDLFVSGSGSISGNLYIQQSASITGNLYVSGNTFLGNNNSDVVTIQADTTASNISSSNFIGWGNRIVRPYGSFHDTTIQTASATPNTALPMYLNTTNSAIGFSIVSGSRITAHYDGVYNVQFSVQLDKTDSGTDEVDIWFRKNGVNISQSNTQYTLLGNNAKQAAALNYIVSLNSGSYIEIMWYSDDVDIRLFAQTSAINPTRPEIPSVIVTIIQV